ncbi:hypothetical protein [Demequina sp.]|uniref:hypothetical protein n=1 Tax=Demequina sp. TaxID=2050685 RepID=UPI0025CBFBBB|nr:hypothetical protein [Demequina sp.]
MTTTHGESGAVRLCAAVSNAGLGDATGAADAVAVVGGDDATARVADAAGVRSARV